MDSIISELARVAGGERAFAEECGLLLSNTYASQVCFTPYIHVVVLIAYV